MMQHPEIQRRAQLEIDTVVGNDRLPTLADRDQLPFVNAICSEVLRMSPSAPIGTILMRNSASKYSWPSAFPHVLCEDDFHAGYFIPKGTAVIANVWKFCHDPRTYTNPFEFNPSRFFSSEKHIAEWDPRNWVFGFGRRNCPGLHFADAAIFITCAMSLAVFDISKPVVNDVPIEQAIEMSSGIISHPLPFKCHITPRSSKAEALILTADSHSTT